MSSAVNDLQRAILGGQQSLTQLLRQTKVIAANLNLNDVECWVDLELGGYPKDADPPKYRTYMAQTLEYRHAVGVVVHITPEPEVDVNTPTLGFGTQSRSD